MSEYSFTSDSDSGSIIMTPSSGSEYSPTASVIESSMIDVTTPSSPSFSSHDSGSDYDDDEGDAEAEWQESLQQLELLLSMVLVPFIGKWVGRKCAYIAWSKFMTWKYPVEAAVAEAAPTIVWLVRVSSPL
ncbi:hypothetical protein HOY80DRAFT_792667 [Tuber brumale]|nr:hypothetical protein HOY80DRAFT_792667 [Tuber brumale]